MVSPVVSWTGAATETTFQGVPRTLTAAVAKDGEWYVARCLEVEMASQGETIDEALAELREALELYLLSAVGVSPVAFVRGSSPTRARSRPPAPSQARHR